MTVAAPRAHVWTAQDADAHLRSLELFGMHFGLERIRALLAELGEPQQRFASVHVVGTNGKTSTSRMLAAILGAEGLQAGVYLSPHLVSFSERVRVGDGEAAGDVFAAAVGRVADAAARVDERLVGGERVTQFEALTAAAFEAFAASGVEVAVVEAGLGGRLDATNVLASRVQVLTNVSLEHTQWLGNTIGEIAREKAAVVQPEATVVVGADLHPEALAVVHEIAGERGAHVITATPASGVDLVVPGAHQRQNFALARAAAEAFLGRPPSAEALHAAARTEIPGRMQTVAGEPHTLIDGAHNPAGAAALAQAVAEPADGRRTVLCVSILRDKDAAAMLRELAALRPVGVVVCGTEDPRALEPRALAALAREVMGPEVEVVVEPEPLLAVGRARVLARPAGLVLATGSLTLMGALVPLPEPAP